MKMKIHLSRAAALLLTAVMLLSVMPAAVLTVSAADTVDGTAPAGTVNVTDGATVTVSQCAANRKGGQNSYEMPSENWSLAMLFDGDTAKGWSTDPYDREQNVNEPVTLTIKLASEANVSAVALFPHGCFPSDYTVSISKDGKSWTKVAEAKGSAPNQSKPVVHSFTAARAQYVQIHMTKRCTQPTGDGYLCQFGEIAVYGAMDAGVTLDRTDITLKVGETDKLTPKITGKAGDAQVKWSSDNESVASVASDGTITAKKNGTASVTVDVNGAKASATVRVADSRIDFDENIMLSIFWPPTPAYINDEQYKLIADAGINWIMGAGEETLATQPNQKKILGLCAKYGIKVIVNDGRFGSGLTSKSEAVIARQVGDYQNATALGGFYILDEPSNANGFVPAYVNLKKAFPEGYMHLNFLPSGAYSTTAVYQAQMNDWCRLCYAGGYPVDYLIYDRYPFGLAAGSMDRAGFYVNLRAVHDVGLENGVRTGTYIQTVKQSVAFRRPTDSEIRYEMYSALAFGFKQLSFFTWFTPVNRSEPFEDGIISPDGTPNAHYETVKTINHEILTIGPILAKCDALEVYLNGSDTWGQPKIPSDFFVQPAKRSQAYTVSFLRHRETGRNYLMVVNNNFNKAQTIDLTFDSRVTSLFEIDRSTGREIPVTMNGQALSLDLAAGDAVLLALPEGVDYLVEESGQPAASVNLMSGAYVTTNQSAGEGGYYVSALTDGRRTSDSEFKGWRSTSNESASLLIDLGESLTFNRMDFYPVGDMFEYALNFPSAFTISASDDGESWKTLITVTGKDKVVGPFKATWKAVKARYVKLDVTGFNGSFADLCELELYNDDGTVPGIEPRVITDTQVVSYTEGSDIARGKHAFCSSTTPDNAGYRSWGWSLDFINNGERGNGWTSNVKVNNKPASTEYVVIDLGDKFDVDRVDVWTMGCFPEDFRIELSDDAQSWTVFAARERYTPEEADLTFTPDGGAPVSGRYLRFIGTKLRGTAADGYMLQLGNISAYGTPTDADPVLQSAMRQFADLGGDTACAAYKACAEAVGTVNMTQSEARVLTRALLALVGVSDVEIVSEPDVAAPDEPETETDAETGAQTEPLPATEPVTDADTAEPATAPDGTQPVESGAASEADTAAAPSGCASAVGAAALLAAMAAAVVLTVRKKHGSS